VLGSQRKGSRRATRRVPAWPTSEHEAEARGRREHDHRAFFWRRREGDTQRSKDASLRRAMAKEISPGLHPRPRGKTTQLLSSFSRSTACWRKDAGVHSIGTRSRRAGAPQPPHRTRAGARKFAAEPRAAPQCLHRCRLCSVRGCVTQGNANSCDNWTRDQSTRG
jgi:hypothetical protein